MEKVTILGESTRSVADLNKWLKSKGCPEYAQLYIDAGKEFGVRGDMALFQSCLETGWFWNNEGPFDVDKSQNNFAGLGATGGGVPGDSFPDARTGIRAQCQDLALRCDTYLPRESIISPYAKKQYDTISNRHSKYWEDLSGTWAADKRYHEQIYRIAGSFDLSLPNSKPEEIPMPTQATWLNIATDRSCVQAMNDGDVVETFDGNSVKTLKSAIEKHPTMGTWAAGDKKKGGVVPPPPPPSGTPVCLDSGHSIHKPGARSNSGTVREEILNEFGTGVIAGILKAKNIGYKWPNPDPDDLTAVGKEGWGEVKIMVSVHHNSYDGSGNPYVCCMVDVGAPMKTKLFAQKVARAITASLKGTPQETKIFEGTSGMEGVYEAELTVINTSAKDPDGNPPIHILPELYFLNKFKDEAQCKEATGKACEAIARCIVEELSA